MFAAFPLSNETNPDAEFAYGAGHINPSKAVNPGLIYDAHVFDYIRFLCGQGYNTKQLQLVTGDRSTCSQSNIGAVWDLNYPSFTVSISQSESIRRYFRRTVTNVGSPTSIYKAKVRAPLGLNIKVDPDILSFQSLGEKLSFNVTVEGVIATSIVSASLVWYDGMHQVRSPIVVYVLS